jgi:hypothetical protein
MKGVGFGINLYCWQLWVDCFVCTVDCVWGIGKFVLDIDNCVEHW